MAVAFHGWSLPLRRVAGWRVQTKEQAAMKGFKRASFALIMSSVNGLLIGCQVTTDTGNAPASATPTQVAQQPATPAPAPSPVRANAGNMPVTLPVLDAFFADEAFASDVKA